MTKRPLMNTITRKSPVRNGLKDISIGDYWKNSAILADVLREKLHGLPVDARRFPRLADEIQVLKELLLALGSRRYGALSFLAFADILHGLDHFLILGDEKPDSQTDGYADDAKEIHRVFVKHETEFRVFKEWLRSQH